MCRWLAYAGDELPLEALLVRPENSLIHQSRSPRIGDGEINADGFGVGWYVPGDRQPGLFRSIRPAWADANLVEIARHVRSARFLAHVRASTGSPVQQTNCHPFRHEGWLWVHNGEVREFPRLHRDLALAVRPDLFPDLQGTTDSELLFLLAVTFGLAEDPVRALRRTAGLVEDVGRAHGVEHTLMMTVAATDGTDVWTVRYSSEGDTRSLFHSADVGAVQRLHPEVGVLSEVSDDTRLVVSEPLVDLPGAWVEYPESSYGLVRDGTVELEPFAPETP